MGILLFHFIKLKMVTTRPVRRAKSPAPSSGGRKTPTSTRKSTKTSTSSSGRKTPTTTRKTATTPRSRKTPTSTASAAKKKETPTKRSTPSSRSRSKSPAPRSRKKATTPAKKATTPAKKAKTTTTTTPSSRRSSSRKSTRSSRGISMSPPPPRKREGTKAVHSTDVLTEEEKIRAKESEVVYHFMGPVGGAFTTISLPIITIAVFLLCTKDSCSVMNYDVVLTGLSELMERVGSPLSPSLF